MMTSGGERRGGQSNKKIQNMLTPGKFIIIRHLGKHNKNDFLGIIPK